jgi:hypothetical protein
MWIDEIFETFGKTTAEKIQRLHFHSILDAKRQMRKEIRRITEKVRKDFG